MSVDQRLCGQDVPHEWVVTGDDGSTVTEACRQCGEHVTGPT